MGEDSKNTESQSGDKEAARLAAENEEMKAKIAARDKADADAKAAEEARKAAAEGKAAEQLTAMQQENAALKAQLAEREEAFKARVENQFKSLPDTIQAKIGDFKDKVSSEVWADMVQKEMEAMPTSGGEGSSPNFTPRPGGKPSAGGPDVYKPGDKTMGLLSKFGREDVLDKVESMKVRRTGIDEEDPTSGLTAFSMSMREIARKRSPKPGTVTSSKQ